MNEFKKGHRIAAKVAAGGVLAGAALAATSVSSPGVEATYATPWSRSNAADLGITGLNEAYDTTASHSVWTNDNTPNELGADCSGYVNKVWAVQYQRAISYDDHGAGSTLTWTNGAVDGSVNISLTDSRSYSSASMRTPSRKFAVSMVKSRPYLCDAA